MKDSQSEREGEERERQTNNERGGREKDRNEREGGERERQTDSERGRGEKDRQRVG